MNERRDLYFRRFFPPFPPLLRDRLEPARDAVLLALSLSHRSYHNVSVGNLQ